MNHIKLLQEKTKLNIQIVNVQEQFLSKLKGVSEPEAKRKIIGHEFITVLSKKFMSTKKIMASNLLTYYRERCTQTSLKV